MKVVVLGAGQLARMMYLAATPLGVDVCAVNPDDSSVVHPVSKDKLDKNLSVALAEANAVTVEFEHIPQDMLAQVNDALPLRPTIQAIAAGADRVQEKALLNHLDIPNCKHLIIKHIDDLDNIVDTLGSKVILKASRDGYDGYGQWRMQSAEDLSELKHTFASLDLAKMPLVAEQMVNFDREISLVGAREVNGNVRCFDIAENLHHEGQLHVSIAPATNISSKVEQTARDIFTRLVEHTNYIGVLAVEMFQIGDELLVNEIAPRVHNSGHWTQNGADTSQFEQHIRAVSGFALGSPEAKGVSAMINIIGCTSFSRDLVAVDGCHLHWYGKSLRTKRKMGHINVVADNYHELSSKLAELSEHLPQNDFPMLAQEIERLKGLSTNS